MHQRCLSRDDSGVAAIGRMAGGYWQGDGVKQTVCKVGEVEGALGQIHAGIAI
jgi:hypothetical protein